MSNVTLHHLDGKLPNLALMRIAAHHRALGDPVRMRHRDVELDLFDREPDLVYGSLIFTRTRPLAERLLEVYPQAQVGGTGWDVGLELEVGQEGVLDYSIYPGFRPSIGFSQRGCRLRCRFCVVPRKEGAIAEVGTIASIWRGEPWPRDLVLLDNDFFGQPAWRDRIAEIRDGGFRVNFNQGINVRLVTDEIAEAIASVDYRDVTFGTRRIYTAFDNPKDERTVMRGLERLVAAGVRPHQIMVYMLIGYWPGETHEHRDARRKAIRDFGALPYPMPYERTPELLGFSRWVVRSVDKRIAWEDFKACRYQLRGLPTLEPEADALTMFDDELVGV